MPCDVAGVRVFGRLPVGGRRERDRLQALSLGRRRRSSEPSPGNTSLIGGSETSNFASAAISGRIKTKPSPIRAIHFLGQLGRREPPQLQLHGAHQALGEKIRIVVTKLKGQARRGGSR